MKFLEFEQIFSFLKDEISSESGDEERLKDKHLYSKTFPLRLLEDAWNAQITWDESKAFRLTALIREAERSDWTKRSLHVCLNQNPSLKLILFIL